MRLLDLMSGVIAPEKLFELLETSMGDNFVSACRDLSRIDGFGEQLLVSEKGPNALCGAVGNERWSADIWFMSNDPKQSEYNKRCTCSNNSYVYYIRSHECHHPELVLLSWVRNHNPDLAKLIDDYISDLNSLSPAATDLIRLLVQKSKEVESQRKRIPATITNIENEPDHVVMYSLTVSGNHPADINLLTSNRLKNGGLSKRLGNFRGSWMAAINSRSPGEWQPYAFIEQFGAEDKRIIRQMFLSGIDLPQGNTMSLSHCDPINVLPPLINTGRLICAREVNTPLSLGKSARIVTDWNCTDLVAGRWELGLQIDGLPAAVLLNTNPPWYFDSKSMTVGLALDPPSALLMDLVKRRVRISTDDIPALYRSFERIGMTEKLPPLPSIRTVDLGVFSPKPILVLEHFLPDDETTGYVIGDVLFNYQGFRVTPNSGKEIFSYSAGQRTRIARDLPHEDFCIKFLESQFLDGSSFSEGGICIAHENDGDDYRAQALRFQRECVPRLIRNGWAIEYADNFDLKFQPTGNWGIEFAESSKGWYDVAIETEINGKKIDLVTVLRGLLENSQFVADIQSEKTTEIWYSRLPSGEYVEMPMETVQRLARLLLEIGSSSKGAVPRISRFDVAALDGLDGAPKVVVSGAEHLKNLRDELSKPIQPLDDARFEGLILPLRDYQNLGVSWLRSRLALGLGVILGDEMAIGKTIQTLAHIWLECQSDHPKSLIVVPPTLISKWLGEKEKFIPRMQIGLYHGPQRESLEKLVSANHVILTTYRTLVIDVEHFLSKNWHIVACDEGHDLRNPAADMTRAVSALKATQKVVISGTPMQNKLEDLWAVTNISVPGLLRDLKWFKQRFVSEPLKDTSIGSRRSNLLGRMVSPFLLARKNKEVGNSLPPVNEVNRFIDMNEAQREVYETVRASMDREVRALIAESGINKNQISILAAIGRLRQICSHPALVKSDQISVHTPSSKLEYLNKMIRELRDEGRAVVVVSQWVEMLKLVSAQLEFENIDHGMLIGEVAVNKREDEIAKFRSGRVPCLLMSMGIGGVGIDIPEGDDIIIVDPWWNPKRIEQVISRLTRDDRDKRINAYHLIMKGTLEEGVLEIAAKKGEMIAAVMEGTSGNVSALDQSDIDKLFGYGKGSDSF